MDDITAARPADSWYELCLFLDTSPTSFGGRLLSLVEKADPGNRERLRGAFPRHVAAWETWRAIAPCTWGELEAAIPTAPKRVTVAFDITDADDRHVLTQALDDYMTKHEGLAVEGDNPDRSAVLAPIARRFRDQAAET